ncbi:MAG: hypothetical protein ACR2H1_10515 [Limisphaerales bacterium]
MHCQIGIAEVFEMLESFTKHPNHSFCEDGALQTEFSAWRRVTGYKQVTDTNLLLIAHRYGHKFVTFDHRIQNRLQDDEKTWVEVIPV